MKQTLTVTNESHFGIARKIVSNMTTESWETIPHCSLTLEPEATRFIEVLKKINGNSSPEEKITLNTAMLRVIVEGLRACPAMNAHIDFKRHLVRGCVKTIEEINISMPMILKTGEMMTVNLHDMHNKSMSEMRDTIADCSRRANGSDLNEVMYEVSLDNTLTGLRQGKLIQTTCRLLGSKTGKHKVKTLSGKAKRDYYAIPTTERLTKHDIEQGTITVSNLGSVCRSWSGSCTLLEIIPPQVCAIAIGSLQTSAMADEDGNLYAGKKLPLTIAFDHRALDMGDITPFINKINEIFARPEIMENWT